MNKTVNSNRIFMILSALVLSLVLIFASTAFVLEASASDTVEGLSFSKDGDADKWHMRKPLESAPYSFEMWIKVPTTIADETRIGYIFSNYDGGSTSNYYGTEKYSNRTVSVEILAGGHPQLKFGNKSASGQSIAFNEVDVRTGEWLHLAIVKEAANVVCYVNGEKKQSIENGEVYHSDSILQPYTLGGENRKANDYYFKGSIKELAVYRDVRTEAEIAYAYSYGVNTADVNMLLCYDLRKAPTELIIKDITGHGYDVMKKAYDGYVPSASDIGAKGTGTLGTGPIDDTNSYDYSFAVVGDTQYITSWDTAYIDGVKNENTHLDLLYDWILANKYKKNIKYVMGLGDITDKYNVKYNGSSSGASHDTAAEWAWAYSQISRLDGEIPYSVVRGNHDNEKYFDQYFANDTYRSQFSDPDYADNSVCFFEEGSVRNAYTKFTVGTEKYLLLLLDYDPSAEALAWAHQVVERNSDYRVIINTHSYLNDDKNLTAQGDKIWEAVVEKYDNVVLVLCGHVITSDIVKTEREGSNENAVTEILINPQSRDGQYKYDTKAGMVAMLYFSNGGKDVRVEYISTVKSTEEEDSYANASVNNFDFKLMNTYLDGKYGRITSEYADAGEYPFVVFSDDGKFLGAYESLFDTTSSYNNDGAVYCAKNYLAVNEWSNGSYGDSPRGAIIWVRDDYALTSNERYENMAQVKGTLVIDLDGHTLTVSDSRALFASTVKPWGAETEYTTEFSVMNGNILLGAKQLISFSASGGSDNLDVSQKRYIHTFTNVKFTVSSTTTNFLAGYSSTVESNPEVVFNECVFDFSAAPDKMVWFNLGNSTIQTNVTVNGGEFILNGNSLVLSKNGTSTSKLTFGKTENGNYTAFTMLNGAELPISGANINGGELDLVKISEVNGCATYRLRPVALADIDFVSKTSITLGSELVYNVYVPAVEYLKSFTVDGNVYPNAETVTLDDGKQYYHISIAMPADEAARNIVLRTTITVNGEDYNGIFTMSIPAYAQKVLRDTDSTDIEKTLVKDVLAYVKAAYIYFDAEDKDDVVSKIDEIIAGYSGVFEKVDGATDADEGLSSIVIVLDEKPAVRFVLPEGVTAEGYTFKSGNATLGYTAGIMTIDGKTYNYAEVSLYAYQMINEITYSNGSVSGSFHINSYYDFVTTDEEHKNNAALISLVEKLYNYCKSAEKYRASVTK